MTAMSPIREDFAGQRQLRFRVDDEPLHLFKNRGESTHQVYLKALVYALYRERYDLVFDPDIGGKYQPHVASLDFTGGVTFWAHCGEIHIDQLAHVLKHSHAEEVLVAKEAVDVPGYVTYIKRHVHYRYLNGKLRIVSFQPLDDWFNPEHVTVTSEDYEIHTF